MPLPSLARRSLLCSLVALPLLAQARADRLPLLLAQDAPDTLDPAGYLVSEKYDGARACWDGRTLRFRSGLPVAAPPWFTAALPAMPLDGELWLERGRFEDLSAAVRRQHADEAEWRQVHYMVFELPGAAGDFAQRATRIGELVRGQRWPQLVAVEQAPVTDRAALQRRLAEVVAGGGEGLVLHRADAAYCTGRSPVLLKLKPQQDADAQVVAHLPGRGRHAGRLGALRVRGSDGVEFDIGSGLTDAQRERPPAIGSVVTYRFRGRTAAGVPRFATFLRLRSV